MISPPLPRTQNQHAFGVDNAPDVDPVPSPVPGVDRFVPALLVYFCKAPKHSESDSTSESPPRPRRYWDTIGPPRVPDPGYVGTPSCAATCTATVSGVFGTQNQETRNPLPPS